MRSRRGARNAARDGGRRTRNTRGITMTEPQGIDISNIQGARWPWSAERGKIAFGMVKATEGLDFTDPDFAANWAAMLGLNRTLCRFAYHFFHPNQDPTRSEE